MTICRVDPLQGGLQLEIHRAGPDDLDTAVDILAEAARWLASRGIRQWPEHGFPAADLIDRIQRGELYIAWLDGGPVATIAIDWNDEEFWGPSEDDAAYVHRMAVRRGWAGQKIGERLLDWAAGQAAAAGKAWVRLDCMNANDGLPNDGLRQYYLDRGWTHVRDVTVEIGTESLFQRPAGAGQADADTRCPPR